MLCDDCPERNTCTELCRPARKYVDQDVVKQRELPVGLPKSQGFSWPESTKSKKELISLMYFVDKLSQAQIVEKLGVSKQYVSRIVRLVKAKADVLGG